MENDEEKAEKKIHSINPKVKVDNSKFFLNVYRLLLYFVEALKNSFIWAMYAISCDFPNKRKVDC